MQWIPWHGAIGTLRRVEGGEGFRRVSATGASAARAAEETRAICGTLMALLPLRMMLSLSGACRGCSTAQEVLFVYVYMYPEY